MVPLNTPVRHQGGHALAQTLVGMALSLMVVGAALAAFAWVQHSHRQWQRQADAQLRLNTALQLFQERLLRAGAPELLIDSKGKAALALLPDSLQGSDNSLSLTHAIRLTPADCQGHQASTWSWLMDDFMLNTRQELVCKDSWRGDTSYQALVDGLNNLQFRYAQVQSGSPALMQWRKAEDISDWNAIRGVAFCLQLPSTGAVSPVSLPCSADAKGLSWRGVAVMRHQTP